MSSYFDIMQRASIDRGVRRLAHQIADSDFPLERYLEFFFPGENYLISEESYADKYQRWGTYGGGGLGSILGPLGTAAGAGLGRLAGWGLGKMRDWSGAKNPQYWQKRFDTAFEQLNQVMQGIGQNSSDPDFVQNMKPQDLIGKIEKAVGEWKKTSNTTGVTASGNNQMTAGQPATQVGSGTDSTANILPNAAGRSQVNAGATAGATNAAGPPLDFGGSFDTASDAGKAAWQTAGASGEMPVPQPPSEDHVKMVKGFFKDNPEKIKELKTQITGDNFSGLEPMLTDRHFDPMFQNMTNDDEKKKFLANVIRGMPESVRHRGPILTESRFRGGYRRIDPRIWD
jgi:hypothetical protein